ncbi:MAG: sigma-70 family RNA polymerase sigma factor [Solirubrobacterales bacterium]|nr:sigma-70 family RNA polymerase sigma factor [Solirubrobacterales bacterium]MCB8971758.1 sigma-70 family RNA polymerase sigma factor [Thermoleophilales bacterium]MCO5327979.1 sigma-70 family RNA polymerase sigma factor [Solirubrobacterales bacterium]
MGAGSANDAELVARCRQGDAAAWSELVELFSGYVYAIAARGFRLGEHDAEDVFQEVFARLFEKLETIRDDSAVRFWIGQTTRRLAIDKLRAGGREAPAHDPELIDETFGADDLELGRLEVALDVRAAVEELPEACREVVVRFFLRDQSYAQIGEAMGIPPGTIASRISRCLTRLRDTYAEGRVPV